MALKSAVCRFRKFKAVSALGILALQHSPLLFPQRAVDFQAFFNHFKPVASHRRFASRHFSSSSGRSRHRPSAKFHVLCNGQDRHIRAPAIDQHALDPGRFEVASEWLTTGRPICSLPLSCGGSLEVTAHNASIEEGLPPGVPSDTKQEWRVLKFLNAEGQSLQIQSVTKVLLRPNSEDGQLKPRMRADCLPLLYCKSLVSAVFAGLVLGRSDGTLQGLRSASSSLLGPKGLRILVVGHGGGSLPSFLSDMLPNSFVDVAELEPAVVEASSEAMGFASNERVRVHVQDGAAFALRISETCSVSDSSAGPYDAVLLDAYSPQGSVPEAFVSPSGAFVRALQTGCLLKEGGVLAVNLSPRFDPAPISAAYRGALVAADMANGTALTGITYFIREPGRTLGGQLAPDTGNFILCQMQGGPKIASIEDLRNLLVGSALATQDLLHCPFNMAELAGGTDETWPLA